MKRTKKIVFIFCIVLLFVGIFSWIINTNVASQSDLFISQERSKAPSKYVAIVLGAKVYYNGTLSPILADRVQTGIELYKENKVSKILFSGDHGTESYDEVNAMKHVALEQGIPAENIFTDHAGFDTYDTMYRAKEIFQVTEALIVTQTYHLPRAVYIARTMGIDAGGVSADKRVYQQQTYNKIREFFATVKAFLDCSVIHPLPRFLGIPVPITGDGNTSNG